MLPSPRLIIGTDDHDRSRQQAPGTPVRRPAHRRRRAARPDHDVAVIEAGSAGLARPDPVPEENVVTTEDDVRTYAATIGWESAHERVLASFARGWEDPDPHAWDSLMSENIVLNQPLLQPGTTRTTWHNEAQRLVKLLPDLRGEIVSWAGHEDVMFIEVRLTATVGGKPLEFRAVDKLWLTPTGTVFRRDSFFDSGPLISTLLQRPSAWLPWWRSGLGPFLARRRFLRR